MIVLTIPTARVLRALLDGPACGTDLMRRLAMPSGAVFPILHRLAAAGLAASEAEDIDPHAEKRPARRYYHLTPLGAEYAREQLAWIADELAPPARLPRPRPGAA